MSEELAACDFHRHRHLAQRAGHEPLTFMTGGAGWKVSPALDIEHELIEPLLFDGMLALQSHRLAL